MILQDVLYLVVTYRYAILIPIALVEGQLISLLVGFLSRTNVFNPFLGALCVMAGNLLGDIILYWLGYHKGEKFAARWGKYLSITDEKVERVRKLFNKHPNKILLGSKLTNGLGLASAVLFTAGTMKVPFRKYMILNVLGESVWTGVLVSIGYFLGDVYLTVNSALEKISLLVVLIVVVGAIVIIAKRSFAQFVTSN